MFRPVGVKTFERPAPETPAVGFLVGVGTVVLGDPDSVSAVCWIETTALLIVADVMVSKS